MHLLGVFPILVAVRLYAGRGSFRGVAPYAAGFGG